MIKDYDCTIEYHPKKANVMANALAVRIVQIPLPLEFRELNVGLTVDDLGAVLENFSARPLMLQEILKTQM